MTLKQYFWGAIVKCVRNQTGFSLIESMIAITLLTMGVLGVTGLTSSIMDHNNDSKKTSIAVTLGQDKIEYIRDIARTSSLTSANGLDSPDLVASVWTTTAGGENVDTEGNAATSGQIFNRSWTITPVTGQFFMYDLVVTMTWQDGGTQTQVLNTQVGQ